MSTERELIHSRIWEEVPEPDNSFAAAACCSGYDVYGDLLGKASWIGYLYLLFRLEYSQFMVLRFSVGMFACYIDATNKPEGSFFPLRCDRVAYAGNPRRVWMRYSEVSRK